ncbi:MAG: hypothetical protein D3923_05980 [Candidatus Electrothrix sp. AR3]|nr:hypothetical protein [Candidatus Electrothrix sp. AR3]
MVQKIVIFVVLAVIGVPSWQVGTIILEKKKATYMLQEQANSIKKHDKEEIVKKNLKKNLELMNLPTSFSFEVLERRKIKLIYRYSGSATLFGYTYYEVNESLEAITE